MALTGDQLKIKGPEYYIYYTDGTRFHLGQLLYREKGYSHYYSGIYPYNNIFIFENTPQRKLIQESTYHRTPIFYEVESVCCCIGFTPLNIYNGIPEDVPLEIQGKQLPINELNRQKGVCPISNFHWCKDKVQYQTYTQK